MQIFLGGNLLGGSDDLLQLISDKALPQLLQQAQGKQALPQQLQDAVEPASQKLAASIDGAFVPPDMPKESYIHLQQLASSMQNVADGIRW